MMKAPGDVVTELEGLEEKLAQFEFRRMFSGEMDMNNATWTSRPAPVVPRLCMKSLETQVRQGENSRGSGVYWST